MDAVWISWQELKAAGMPANEALPLAVMVTERRVPVGCVVSESSPLPKHLLSFSGQPDQSVQHVLVSGLRAIVEPWPYGSYVSNPCSACIRSAHEV